MKADLSRRSLLILPLAAALPHRARAALPPFTDAAGRTMRLKGPPERIVIAFNFEEFTAVAGPSGWDRVVGFGRKQWAVNRQAVWTHYLTAIPALANLADVGVADDKSFSVESVLGLRPDLLIIHEWGFRTMAPLMQQIEQAGVPILVIDYNAQDPRKHVASTLALGAAMGSTDRAKALADLYLDRLADISRRAAGAPAPRSMSRQPRGRGCRWQHLQQRHVGPHAGDGRWLQYRQRQHSHGLGTHGTRGSAGRGAGLHVHDWLLLGQRAQCRAGGFRRRPGDRQRSLVPYRDRPGSTLLPAIRSGELHTIEAGLDDAYATGTSGGIAKQ